MHIWLLIPWQQRIINAINNKHFTKSDIELSKLWITDPISELQGVIKFKNNQHCEGPCDLNIIIDAIYFTKFVEDNTPVSINSALLSIKSINKRVFQLHNILPWELIPNLKPISISL